MLLHPYLLFFFCTYVYTCSCTVGCVTVCSHPHAWACNKILGTSDYFGSELSGRVCHCSKFMVTKDGAAGEAASGSRETWMLALHLLGPWPWPQPTWWHRLHSGWVLPPQFNLPENVLTDTSGDSNPVKVKIKISPHSRSKLCSLFFFLVYLSILLTMPGCHDDCTLIVSHKVSYGSPFILFFNNALLFVGLLLLSVNFRSSLLITTKHLLGLCLDYD